jgi:hypothetical protein
MYEIWNITPEGKLKSNHNAFTYQFRTSKEAELMLAKLNVDQLQFPLQHRMSYEIREVINHNNVIKATIDIVAPFIKFC